MAGALTIIPDLNANRQGWGQAWAALQLLEGRKYRVHSHQLLIYIFFHTQHAYTVIRDINLHKNARLTTQYFDVCAQSQSLFASCEHGYVLQLH